MAKKVQQRTVQYKNIQKPKPTYTIAGENE